MLRRLAHLLRALAAWIDPPRRDVFAEQRARTRNYVRHLTHSREADLIDLNAPWTPRDNPTIVERPDFDDTWPDFFRPWDEDGEELTVRTGVTR